MLYVDYLVYYLKKFQTIISTRFTNTINKSGILQQQKNSIQPELDRIISNFIFKSYRLDSQRTKLKRLYRIPKFDLTCLIYPFELFGPIIAVYIGLD